MSTKNSQQIVSPLFHCRCKRYFHSRQRTLLDSYGDARKVFREVYASKQDLFRISCWILLNPTTIRFHPSSLSTSCPVCFHAQLNPYRRVRVWRRKKGRKFHLAGKWEEKTVHELETRNHRTGKSDGPRKIPRRYYALTYRPGRIMVTPCDF